MNFFLFFSIKVVNGISMYNTLKDGDLILIKKTDFVELNNLIVFKKNSVVYVKRCVCMPGCTLHIINNVVFCNNIKNLSVNFEDSIADPRNNVMIYEQYGINWHFGKFGPLYIPKKEQSIFLSYKNIDIYKNVIMEEQNIHNNIDWEKFLYENKSKYYKFLHNYYFALGDNMHHSDDSRIFGLVRQDEMIGKSISKLYYSKK